MGWAGVADRGSGCSLGGGSRFLSGTQAPWAPGRGWAGTRRARVGRQHSAICRSLTIAVRHDQVVHEYTLNQPSSRSRCPISLACAFLSSALAALSGPMNLVRYSRPPCMNSASLGNCLPADQTKAGICSCGMSALPSANALAIFSALDSWNRCRSARCFYPSQNSCISSSR